MVARFESYRVKRRDNLADPDFWNGRFRDLDNRLTARELDSTRIDLVVDALEAVALQRLNDTFTPLIVEAQARLNNLGASFSAESLDTVAISTGEKTFILTDETAEMYVYTDYINIRATSAPDNSMLARVISFDRAEKALTVDVVHTEGSGTYGGWLLRVGAPIDLTHADRTDNPHQTTAAQVGAYTIAEAEAVIAAAIAAIPGVDLSSRLARDQNLADLTDVAAARTALGLKLLATQDTVGWSQLASNIFATAANFRAKAANKILTAEAAWDAATPVDLGAALAGTVTLDGSAGINFAGTLGGNITLAFTNMKNGQSGGFYWNQGSGAGRTVSFSGAWYPIDGRWPTFVTTAGNWNYISWQCCGGNMVLSGGKWTG